MLIMFYEFLHIILAIKRVQLISYNTFHIQLKSKHYKSSSQKPNKSKFKSKEGNSIRSKIHVEGKICNDHQRKFILFSRWKLKPKQEMKHNQGNEISRED
ncbi:hypothetical protein Droror1_Dr00000050 [Drosera rotundifolia]